MIEWAYACGAKPLPATKIDKYLKYLLKTTVYGLE